MTYAKRAERYQPPMAVLRALVGLRVVIISTLIISALLIQLTFSIELPLKPIYHLAALAYGLSLLALFALHHLPPEANAAAQILCDIVIITGLVYISGGPDSGFTFLYLGAVSSGAILLGRYGGLVAAGLAAVFYAVLVDLMYFGVIPVLDPGDFPARVWTVPGLVANVTLNIVAFLATGLLVAAASEQLRQTRADLDRRKEEMEKLQALHASVLNSMSSGVLTTDLKGVVTYSNPSASELLRVPQGGLTGRNVLSLGLLDPDVWPRILKAENELLRFEGNRTVLGPEYYFGVSVTALRDGHGKTSGRILIFQNLTAMKKLESEVRLNEKMAAVGELAAAIAHEIRNPLASISGSVQVLKGSAPAGSANHRLMEIVVRESKRLSEILEDFLKYTKPRERAAEAVDAPSALRDVMTLLRHSDELSGKHKLEVRVEPEALVIQADAGQIRQVFWNLARNAIAAMPEGGTLKVESRVDGDIWTVVISDTGKGMTPEERDRLFTPFAHSFPGGTGLGLAIVHRIVTEHGGGIRVETAPEKGTAISLTFPITGARAAGVARPGLPDLDKAFQREVA